ncbi:MAG: hypothetical protein ACAH95_17905 [Fimbriimonas sp.]
MALWKMPPKAKVYEALTAVADGRVKLLTENSAEVSSSGGDKVYKVTWNWDRDEISSSDPASRFQGYVGYPIIAVLLSTGRLEYDSLLAQKLGGVAWKEINDRFKRDYDAAVRHVLAERKIGPELDTLVDRLYSQIEDMKLLRP